MEEVIRKFVAWTKLKIKIHLIERVVYFRAGEIWWASLGVNVGFEQDGKNMDFERPILIVRKFNAHVLWAVPLTTKLKDIPYYYQYDFAGTKYSAILIQLRLISSKRLLRKIGLFPRADFKNIKEQLKKMI